jgi:hypothetical protein
MAVTGSDSREKKERYSLKKGNAREYQAQSRIVAVTLGNPQPFYLEREAAAYRQDPT